MVVSSRIWAKTRACVLKRLHIAVQDDFNNLTLAQTTNFGFSQTEKFADDNFKFD